MKKTFLTLAVLMASQFAQAQYIGIKSLPSSTNVLPEILEKAILEKNYMLVEQWRKDMGTFSFPYSTTDKKTQCIISHTQNGTSTNQMNYKKDRDIPNIKGSYASIPEPYRQFPIMTTCNNLPLLTFFSTHNPRNNLNTAILTNAKITPEMENQMKYGIDFVNSLQPNQFDQLVLILKIRGVEPQVQNLAWDKLVEFWPQRNSTMTPNQKEYYSNYDDWFKKEGKTYNHVIDHYDYLMLNDPINFLFFKELNSFLALSSSLAESEFYKTGKVDKLGKKYFLGEQSIDLKKALKNIPYESQKELYLNTYYSAERLKKIMAHPEFKMNLQNPNGETFLHYIIKSNYISNNNIIAAFLRASLENGAKVELKNKEGLNPYEYFSKNRQVNHQSNFANPMQPMLDAFHMETYE